MTQKDLEPVKGELKEKDVLTENLRNAVKAIKRGGGQRRRQGEVMENLRYEIYVQEYLYGFAWAVHDPVLDCPKLETPELCSIWKSCL